MAFGFLRNPVSAVLGVIRSIVNPAGALRQPFGSAIGSIGRALARLGAQVEASAIRARLDREQAAERQSATALGTAKVRPLTDADIPEAATKLRRRYSYTVRVLYMDVRTGQKVTRHVTISSDSILDNETVSQNAESMVLRDYGVESAHLIDSTVTGVKRAGAAGSL